ncbi:Lnb N-terminal periplasmic domain-containing protein [Natronoflexus pectinivorans]|nr:DUF4105 domain-containing protein [Natronoflexus pectinivorans]
MRNHNHSKESLKANGFYKSHLKYWILSFLILLNSFSPIKSQLSPDASISILTCAPGDELYSLFGHTAIRVQDPVTDTDYVFNYGTFNFNTPNFYLKFMRGQLNYMLSVTSYQHFLYEYQFTGRSVWEQTLDLTQSEKQQLFRALIINAEPENRYYQYHFFFDNCATRVRDMALLFIPDGVSFEIPDYLEGMTFRDAIAYYLQNKPWTKLGLDILLGQPTDDLVDESSIQFLPDYLMWQFETAVRNNNNQPVILNTRTILEFDEESTYPILSPMVVLWIVSLIIIAISAWEYKRKIFIKWINVAIFSTTSILGLLICFLWFFTEHSVTGPNWHLLWANPLHLFVIRAAWYNNRINRYINLLVLMALVVILTGFSFVPQYIPASLVPLWLVLIIRLLMVARVKPGPLKKND